MYSRPIEVLEDGSSPALGEVMESIFPNLRFKDENGKGTVCEDMLRSSELFDESGEEGTEKTNLPKRAIIVHVIYKKLRNVGCAGVCTLSSSFNPCKPPNFHSPAELPLD